MKLAIRVKSAASVLVIPDPRSWSRLVYVTSSEFRHETRGDAEGKQASEALSSLKLAGIRA